MRIGLHSTSSALGPVVNRRHLAPIGSTSRSSRRAGSPGPYPTRVILSQALTLLQSIADSYTFAPAKVPHDPFELSRATPCWWQTTFQGFVPFSVFRSFGALFSWRFPQLPRPCALRVLHPLDALLPKWPFGLISFRFHSWDLTLQGFIPLPTRSLLSDCVTLMAFGIVTFMTLLCLQGFIHRQSYARLAKVIHPPCCASLPGFCLL